jgi:putative NADH-flavin reductase
VTAVVRDPAKYPDLAGDRVTVVAGDVTDADSVAAVAARHDAAINAATRLDMPAGAFYVTAAHALLDGLARAGVGRLVAIGIGTTLEAAPGVAVHDAPGFPAEGRVFSLGQAAGLAVLRGADTEIDWLVLAPPPTMLDNDAARTGRYRIGGTRSCLSTPARPCSPTPTSPSPWWTRSTPRNTIAQWSPWPRTIGRRGARVIECQTPRLPVATRWSSRNT